MEKSIIINSTEYKIPTINYGTLCELEDLGVDFQDIENKPFKFIRAIVSIATGQGLKKASEEIDKHISNGGSFDDFMPLFDAIRESDFFQGLSKKRKK